MRFDRDPRLEREILDRLRAKYVTPKKSPHVTQLIYCLTKAWFDGVDPKPVTDTELLYFSIGFAMEQVVLRDEPVAEPLTVEGVPIDVLKNPVPPESTQMDGIYLTLDYLDLQGMGVDLKSTRSPYDASGVPKYGWTTTWMQQFMAYARLLKQTTFGVVVIQLTKPDLIGGTFTYTEDEIEANWQYILGRLETFHQAIAAGEPPQSFAHTAVDEHGKPTDWECKNCRYRSRCYSLTGRYSDGTARYADKV